MLGKPCMPATLIFQENLKYAIAWMDVPTLGQIQGAQYSSKEIFENIH